MQIYRTKDPNYHPKNKQYDLLNNGIFTVTSTSMNGVLLSAPIEEIAKVLKNENKAIKYF